MSHYAQRPWEKHLPSSLHGYQLQPEQVRESGRITHPYHSAIPPIPRIQCGIAGWLKQDFNVPGN